MYISFLTPDEIPGELHDWFSQVLVALPPKCKTSKWFFSSQILAQLVHDLFGLDTICLLASMQRVLTSVAPQLLEVEPDVLQAASSELSQALCEQRFLDCPEEEDM